MDSQELFKLSFNSLKANKMRSILTTLGIIIGVFSVILLVSLGNGLQSFITEQISSLGSNLMFVMPGRVGSGQGPGESVNRLTFPLVSYLEGRLGSSAYVSPYASKLSIIKYANKSDKDALITGSNANLPNIIKWELTSGAFFTKSQDRSASKVAVIGNSVKDQLFKNIDPVGKKITIAGSRYTVIGVLEKRGSVFGQDQDNTAVIPINTFKKQFATTTPTYIYITAVESELVPYVKKRTEEILKTRLDEEDFTVMTSEQTLETITSITGVLTVALGGIAAISLLVGGIGVMNIMLVSVTERTKEIGLRKALGAKREDILFQFLLEAVMLSLTGGIIGVILGILASAIVSLFFTTQVTLWSILLAFTFSTAVGIIFGLTPAIRASRLSPIDALRYE
jgi:putative ABC transport system permease protein